MRIAMSRTLGSFLVCISFAVTTIYANPLGGVVTHGTATITPGAGLLTVNQTSSRAIINWGSFSIANGETTTFEFDGPAGAHSAVLNRVNFGNPSIIAGMLQSRVGPSGPAGGAVLILNPSGLLFTPTAQVNVGSLVATTLGLADDHQFLDTRSLTLTGPSTAGILNQGNLHVFDDIYLIAHTVRNDGNITAGSHAGLAAGTTVTLARSGSERLSVVAGTPGTGAATGVENSAAGQINAVTAELKAAGGNIYALAVNNGGVVRADTVVHEGGHIYLRAGSGSVVNSGALEARGTGASSKGGEVQVTGGNIVLAEGSTVDVSGNAGGGKALIGGDFHGANAAVPNSTHTVVEQGATIRADSLRHGDAGQVAVWSDGTTEFNGSLSAQALGASGAGGRAEISGREHLAISGHSFLSGAHGAKGSLLLDPGSVDILHEASGNTPPSGNVDTFFDDWIVDQLNNGGANLTISTANSLNGGVEDLAVHSGANISWNSANNFSLIGNHSVTISGTIANAGWGSFSVQSGGPITFNTPGSLVAPNVQTAGGGQTYNGAVAIGADTVLKDTANGMIQFNSTINAAAPTLTVTPVSGGVSLDWASGYHHFDLQAFDFGTLSWNTIASDLQVNHFVVLGGSGNAFRLTGIAGQAGADFGLTVSAAGAGSVFGGAVGNNIAIGSLDATGPLALNGGSVRTLGSQNFHNQTTLGADTTLTGTTLDLDAVNGQNNNLVLNNSALATLHGTISGVKVLTASGSGTLAINNTVAANKFTDNESTTLTLPPAGAITTTAGNGQDGSQSYTAPLTLSADATLTGTTLDLDAVNGQNNSLALNNSALATLHGTVSGVKVLTASGSGTLAINNTVAANKVTDNESTTLTLPPAGAITTTAGNGQDGSQSYTAPLTLGADATLTGTTLDLSAVIGQNNSLVINNSALATLHGTVSGVKVLTASGGGTLAINNTVAANKVTDNEGTTLTLPPAGAITTTAGNGQDGSQSYTAPLTLGANATLTGTALDLSAVIGQNHGLTLNNSGSATLHDVVNQLDALLALGSGTLTVNNPVSAATVLDNEVTTLFADVTTLGAQNYDADVILGGSVTLSATLGGFITFNQKVNSDINGPWSLNVNTHSDEIFNGIVGGDHALANLTTDSSGAPAGRAQFNADALQAPVGKGAVNAGTVTINDGTVFNVANSSQATPTIKTTGAQIYNGAAELYKDTVLRSVGAGDITFNDTVDGFSIFEPHSLEVYTGGTTFFNGQVGNFVPLQSLFTDNDAGVADWNGATGERTVLDAVGSFSQPTVKTLGAQTYSDPIVLNQDTVLRSMQNGDITFFGTIDGDGFLTGRSLEVDTGGATIFHGRVGYQGGAISTLTTDNDPSAPDWDGSSGERTVLDVAGTTGVPSIKTFKGQTYNDPVVLSQDTVVRSFGQGDITFNSTIDGDGFVSGRSLEVDTGGITTFGGRVGYQGGAISTLTTDNDPSAPDWNGTTGERTVLDVAGTFNQPSIKTFKGQTYNDPVVLSQDTVVRSFGQGDITFNSTIDGDGFVNGRSLEVDTGGTTFFHGRVGSQGAISTLTTDNDPSAPDWDGSSGERTVLDVAGTVGQPSIKTLGGQTYNDSVVLQQNTVLKSANQGDIVFGSTVDGDGVAARNFEVDTGGQTRFNGLVGSHSALQSLTTDNDAGTPDWNGTTGERTTFNAAPSSGAATVQTLGAQIYHDPVMLEQNTVLTASSVIFDTTVDGDNVQPRDLTVNASGGTTVLNGTVSAGAVAIGGADVVFSQDVGSHAALGTLTVNSTGGGGGSAIDVQHDVTTSGAQNYNADVFLSGNVTLSSSAGGNITFNQKVNSDINGPWSLNVNTAGDEVFNGIVGGDNALANLSTDSNGGLGGQARFNVDATQAPVGKGAVNAGTVTLNDPAVFNVVHSSPATPTIKTTGAQVYNSVVELDQDTVLSSVGAGDISFNDTVNSGATPRSLEVYTGGTTFFNGLVGNLAPLQSLFTDNDPGVADWDGLNGERTVLNAAGSFSQPTVKTLGAQTYSDSIVLNQNTVLRSMQNGDITFNSTIDGDGFLTGRSLEVDTGGATIFHGRVGYQGGAISTLTTDNDPSAPDWNGTSGERTVLDVAGTVSQPSIKTFKGQTYHDPVVLSRDTVVSSFGQGDIIFSSTIDGDGFVSGRSLEVDTGGATIFHGRVGYQSGAISTLTTDNDPSAADWNGTTGERTVLDVAGTFNQPSIKTFKGQTYNDPVVLSQDTVARSFGQGDITFNSTIDGDGFVSGRSLEVDTGGTTFFHGRVGFQGGAISTLTTDNDPNAPDWNGASGEHTVLDVAGTFSQPSIKTFKGQTYNDAVVLNQDTVVRSFGQGDITFNGTIDGDGFLTGRSLEVDTGGITTFSGRVGYQGGALSSVTTDNDAGAADWNGTTGERTVFNVAGTLAVPSIKTLGGQTYNDAVVLQQDTVVKSFGQGDITFDRTIDGDGIAARSLDVYTGGRTIFGGAIGTHAALSSLTTDYEGTLATEKTLINGGTVSAANVNFRDDVVLGNDLTVNGGTVTFGRTVNGDLQDVRSLLVNASGTTTFGGAVGNNARLASVTTDASGATAINGGSVTTSGDQTYNDDVTLGLDTTLTSAGNQNITFAKTLNGAQSLNVVTAGTTTFGGAVGNNTALAKLTTDTGGTTAINGGAITTSGDQTYNDDVTLGADAILASAGGGNITFARTVNGAQRLDVVTAGTTTFNGQVGNATPLSRLVTDAPGVTALNGGAVTTSGDQTYNDSVTLGADAILTSTGNGNITFANTLNGAQTLDVNTGGTTTFGGTVGNSVPLIQLTTDASGATVISGGTVTTGGAQNYNDDVTLGADATLTSIGNGNVTFGKTVNGPYRLDVVTGGSTVFNGQVGNTTPLTRLTTDAAGSTALNGGAVTTTGDQIYNDDVALGVDTTLASTGNGNIAFSKTLNGDHRLDVNASGTTTFLGQVGNTTPLSSLATDEPGTTAINGGTVTTTGSQTYNDDVILGSATTLTSFGNGNITLAKTVNGSQSLEVDTAGITTFGGLVGNNTPLTTLTTDLPGSTAINGGGVTTSGGQNYNDNVTLGADAVLASTGNGNITFGGTINGSHRLDLNTAGPTTFSRSVGNTTPLSSLSTDAAGTTAINGGEATTSGAQTYNDDITLGAETTLTSSGAGDITLTKTVNGAHALTVVTAGTTTFGGAVGNNAPLASIATGAGGSTAINGGAVTTSGIQVYNDDVTLGADATLTSTGDGNIVFGQTLNGGHNLAINTGGTAIFSGRVGNTAALSSLTTDAAGATAINGGAVTTSGAQTYNDEVTLGADTTLASLFNGNIKFGQTLDGAFELTVNTGGETRFNGVVGSQTPLARLTTDNDPNAGDWDGFTGERTVVNAQCTINSSGKILVNSVHTTGQQRYNDPVVLEQDACFTGKPVLFKGGVSGAPNITPAPELVINNIVVSFLSEDVQRRLLGALLPKEHKVQAKPAKGTGAGVVYPALVPVDGSFRTQSEL